MNATHLTLNNSRFAMSDDLTPASLFAVRESPLSAGAPTQSTSHSLFAQLRSQYPTGALTSELVQIHDGQFVVRALVQVGNAILATGMAAADRIEIAEDCARIRAMEVLGIAPTVPSAYGVQAQLVTEAPREPEFSAASLNALKDAKLPTFESQEIEEIAPPKAIRGGEKKEFSEKPASVSSGSDDFLSTFPGLDLPEAVQAPAEAEYDYSQDVEADLPEETIAPQEMEAVKVSVPDVEFSSDPIDLSDAIAQIGTEIERIGWTKKQGSTYLQKTYSKKTRAELTEDELLEFLHYLKALPSKGQPSLSQIPF
ncbi:hypothetical protein C7B65_13410 [Phormidesmis priestleyi ULC007]|uniref:Uncharacterized protein n=2 Tax=Phormidesmis priestleyi TaxID=268141 RepID=A0A2T1DEV4_9CYAN|nr:hypothetical protein [Phormidesmis priestleyi]PSB19007.1 hypothetical protein C7B65_13410 [Phormidesmis priestleyi ULC007]PZO53995.1 MAG: hypothetical protein DCF14_03465 [Phormidesmis priestleyi]